MRKIISRATRVIDVWFTRFVDWFNDPVKRVMPKAIKVFGGIGSAYGIFLISYAMSLEMPIAAIGLTSGLGVFLSGIALTMIRINGYAGGVK